MARTAPWHKNFNQGGYKGRYAFLRQFAKLAAYCFSPPFTVPQGWEGSGICLEQMVSHSSQTFTVIDYCKALRKTMRLTISASFPMREQGPEKVRGSPKVTQRVIKAVRIQTRAFLGRPLWQEMASAGVAMA